MSLTVYRRYRRRLIFSHSRHPHRPSRSSLETTLDDDEFQIRLPGMRVFFIFAGVIMHRVEKEKRQSGKSRLIFNFYFL